MADEQRVSQAGVTVLGTPSGEELQVSQAGATIPGAVVNGALQVSQAGATIVAHVGNVWAHGTAFGNGGEEIARPVRGDRAAWDTGRYPEHHAIDLKDDLPKRHNPWPMPAGYVAQSDGSKLVPTDNADQAELDAHIADFENHHSRHENGGADQVRVVLVNTRANILATTPAQSGVLAYTTDTAEFFLYDGTNWRVAPLELKTENETPDMGAHTTDQLEPSDRAGYYDDAITDKALSNVRILESAVEEEGAIRTTTGGLFQVYLNGVWNDVVVNFRLREDSEGSYELEHRPIGFDLWYEVMSGNSDQLGLDGRPLVTQYSASMGAYQRDLVIDGGTF